jgi:hypothetical protein
VRESNEKRSNMHVGQSLEHQSFDEVVNNTSNSWLMNQNRTERRNRMNAGNNEAAMLPEIDTTPGRKRSMQGGMSTGNKVAAGFKRE